MLIFKNVLISALLPALEAWNCRWYQPLHTQFFSLHIHMQHSLNMLNQVMAQAGQRQVVCDLLLRMAQSLEYELAFFIYYFRLWLTTDNWSHGKWKLISSGNTACFRGSLSLSKIAHSDFCWEHCLSCWAVRYDMSTLLSVPAKVRLCLLVYLVRRCYVSFSSSPDGWHLEICLHISFFGFDCVVARLLPVYVVAGLAVWF